MNRKIKLLFILCICSYAPAYAQDAKPLKIRNVTGVDNVFLIQEEDSLSVDRWLNTCADFQDIPVSEKTIFKIIGSRSELIVCYNGHRYSTSLAGRHSLQDLVKGTIKGNKDKKAESIIVNVNLMGDEETPPLYRQCLDAIQDKKVTSAYPYSIAFDVLDSDTGEIITSLGDTARLYLKLENRTDTDLYFDAIFFAEDGSFSCFPHPIELRAGGKRSITDIDNGIGFEQVLPNQNVISIYVIASDRRDFSLKHLFTERVTDGDWSKTGKIGVSNKVIFNMDLQ